MLYFLRKLNDIHPKKQQEPMRPSGNPSTADRDKLPTCGRDLISQVNERVAAIEPGRVVHERRFPQCVPAVTGSRQLGDKALDFLVGGVHRT